MMLDENIIGVPLPGLGTLICSARRYMKQCLTQMGKPFGINAYQYCLLIMLRERGPQFMSSLSRKLWVDLPTISKLVADLQRKGYVDIITHNVRGKRSKVALSEARASHVENLYIQMVLFRNQLEGGLSGHDILHAKRCLNQINTNLETVVKSIMLNKLAAKIEVRTPSW